MLLQLPTPLRLRPAIHLAPGLLLAGLLAAAATWSAQWRLPGTLGLSTLTLAILLGMVVGNLAPAAVLAPSAAGIQLAKQQLLRLGIVLYGVRLSLTDVAQVGWAAVALDALVLTSTFLVACLLGMKLLRLPMRDAMLIGAGSAICGAAAVLATAPVTRSRADQVAVAVATVVVFGTLATFLYPWLYGAALHLEWLAQPRLFGIFTGATVHEVAQVVAVGQAVDPAAADAAVVTKMVRVMLLAPFLLTLSWWLGRQHTAVEEGPRRLHIPWFAVGFIAVAGANTLWPLAEPLRAALVQLDDALLAAAMAALGLGTRIGAVREAGLRPLLLAALLFGWLLLVGLAGLYWLPFGTA